ncbi:MAG: 16S rRNA processing protein RimM [Lachnospiraceae bacterium]|nr:16S rRNA processing protein RimM [Lachnospiraceae bacterium]MBQ5484816.1 16S rRNA processing protein RimM [Lachnospiraceae bacterium]
MAIEFLQVGVITTTHGVRGEVKVFPTTDDMHRFKRLKTVTLEKPDGSRSQLHIRSVKFFKKQVILGFDEVCDMDAAALLRKCALMIPREEAEELGEGEYFVGDILGIDVVLEDGSAYGKVSDILVTGANDVYEITKEDGKKVLVPAIKSCILGVDLDKGCMKIHLLPGLEEL